MSEALSMWVVYDHPRDFPDGYIARRWEIRAGQNYPTQGTMASTSLDTIRSHLQKKGLVKIERSVQDDPCILETWI